jgi:protein-disulfide isomerase
VPLLEQVLEKNPDTVKMVFKNMPLRFHQFAEPSARAALAAFKQDKFWQFHDELFKSEKLSNEVINNIAVDLELDMAQFNNDKNSAEITKMIEKDLMDAQKVGVTGTPTIFINGKKLKNRSLQGFQMMIDQELKGS